MTPRHVPLASVSDTSTRRQRSRSPDRRLGVQHPFSLRCSHTGRPSSGSPSRASPCGDRPFGGNVRQACSRSSKASMKACSSPAVAAASTAALAAPSVATSPTNETIELSCLCPSSASRPRRPGGRPYQHLRARAERLRNAPAPGPARGWATSPSAGSTTIRAWVDAWNANPKPFKWVKSAEEIFPSITSYLQANLKLRTLGRVWGGVR